MSWTRLMTEKYRRANTARRINCREFEIQEPVNPEQSDRVGRLWLPTAIKSFERSGLNGARKELAWISFDGNPLKFSFDEKGWIFLISCFLAVRNISWNARLIFCMILANFVLNGQTAPSLLHADEQDLAHWDVRNETKRNKTKTL